MLRRNDWIQDPRPIKWGSKPETSWQQWVDKHHKPKEHWFMGIVDFLLKHQDWSGAYLLMRTYIASCKQSEGVRLYNKNPVDESPHVRSLRLWFWELVEKHRFAAEEPEKEWLPYDDDDTELTKRRKIEQTNAQAYPFVGGRPKRRYTETVEFFQQLAQERSKYCPRKRPADTPGKKKRGA